MKENSAKSAIAEKDPVCGMTVDPSIAKYKFEHAGKVYYFCCSSCLEKFRADPVGFLTSHAASHAGMSSQAPAGPHSQPHTQMISIAPVQPAGTMAVPESPAPARSTGPTQTTGSYVCPMCPEVDATKPGACPSCGMALERGDAGRSNAGGIHLPDASADRPVGAGALSYLRHGIGAAHCHCARRGKS